MTAEQAFTVYPVDRERERMYCGPTVLALLTGKGKEEIRADVNRLRRAHGKKKRKTLYYRDGTYKTQKLVPWPLTSPVRGLSETYMEKLLKKYGCNPKSHIERYPSLRRLVEDMGHFKTPIVVNAGCHYVLYFQGKIYDTFRPEGAPVKEHPYGLCRVTRYWIIRNQKPTTKGE